MDRQLSLPARLDTASASAVARMLGDVRGQPAVIDGSAVTAAGALGLQVLVSACRTWRSEDREFRVVAPSDALMSACRILGIGPSDIGIETDRRST